MTNLIRFASVALLGFCVACSAQNDKDKPAGESKKPSMQEPKDDGPTAADKAIQTIDKFTMKQNVDKKSANWRLMLKEPPKLEFDAKCDYLWHIETELGSMTIRFLPEVAPMHVSSGIYLARLGYFDGLTFHRIIPGFMAQGGCPLGTGSGGPGYQFAGEPSPKAKHDKAGILSMANAGPNTDGSQFFITFGKQPGLDGGYTVWGEVIEGIETVKALEGKGIRANNGMLPKEKHVKIVRTSIQVAPKPEPKPEPAKDAPKDGDKK